MHAMLMDAATGPGAGEPVTLLRNHSCQSMDSGLGVISFSHGVSVRHDLVIGADGIGASYSTNRCPATHFPNMFGYLFSLLSVDLLELSRSASEPLPCVTTVCCRPPRYTG